MMILISSTRKPSKRSKSHLGGSALQIVDSHRGLAIQLRDESSMHNVSFDNITISTRYYNQTWWGGAEPIYVVATPRTATTQVGQGRATC